jgi:hypothetical protein
VQEFSSLRVDLPVKKGFVFYLLRDLDLRGMTFLGPDQGHHEIRIGFCFLTSCEINCKIGSILRLSKSCFPFFVIWFLQLGGSAGHEFRSCLSGFVERVFPGSRSSRGER